MNKIQKVSTYVLGVFKVLSIALPVLIVLNWLFIDTETVKSLMSQGVLGKPIETPEGYMNLSLVHWTVPSKWVGFISDLIGMLPVFLSLFYLRKIFSNYKRAEIFNTLNAKYYNCLGWLCFLDALLAQPLSDGLMILAVTLSNPPGHRYISFGFGTPNVEALLCGILVIVISWVMLEASKLNDEQKFTI